MEENDLPTILFTNLQLLGMDVEAMEGKYHIAFNKDMFNLPNKAGSEAVLQFLFERLDPKHFKEMFRDCWPVIDRKAELQFRKMCNTWLLNIHADHPEAHLPRNNASLLLTPGGHKYIEMLYRLSTHVLVQTMEKETGFDPEDSLAYPVLNKTMFAFKDTMKIALEESCQQLKTEYFKQLHLTVAGHRKWRESAEEMVKSYRHLSRSTRDLENEKRLLVNSLAENAQRQGLHLPAKRTISMFDSNQDAFFKRRIERMKKVEMQWKEILEFYEQMIDKREILRSILDPSPDKPVINGAELGIRVPNLLLQDFQQEIKRQEIDNVYIGGHLNLESLSLLWNMSLKRYRDQLKEGVGHDLSSDLPEISNQLQQHHAHLQEAQKLRDDIENVALPKVQDELEKLRQKIRNFTAVSWQGNITNNQNASPGLTAPTPPLALSTRSAKSGATPTGPVTSIRPKHDTPDAITTVVGNVEKTIHLSNELAPNSKSKSTHLASRRQTLLKKSGSDVAGGNLLGVKTAVKPPISRKVTAIKENKAKTTRKSRPLTNEALTSCAARQEKSQIAKGHPLSTNASIARNQNADDVLANKVVSSVLDPDASGRDVWASVSGEVSSDNFCTSPLDLGKNAFVSKDLIGRSPQTSCQSSFSSQFDSIPHSRSPEVKDPFSPVSSTFYENGLHRQASDLVKISPRQSSPPFKTRTKTSKAGSGFFSPVNSSSMEDTLHYNSTETLGTMQNSSGSLVSQDVSENVSIRRAGHSAQKSGSLEVEETITQTLTPKAENLQLGDESPQSMSFHSPLLKMHTSMRSDLTPQDYPNLVSPRSNLDIGSERRESPRDLIKFGVDLSQLSLQAAQAGSGYVAGNTDNFLQLRKEDDKNLMDFIDHFSPPLESDIPSVRRAYNLRNFGDNAEEQDYPSQNLPRVPGDGHDSCESDDNDDNDDDDTASQLQSLSKDSLMSPTVAVKLKKTPPSPCDVDDLISSVRNTLDNEIQQSVLWEDSLCETTPEAATSVIKESYDENKGRSEPDQTSGANASNVSLLDLDSGDDLVLDDKEFYSPLKGGIVLASGLSPPKSTLERKCERSPQRPRGTPVSSHSSEWRVSPSRSSRPVGSDGLYNLSQGRIDNSQTPIEKAGVGVSKSNDIQAQMARLQQRFADILNDSSEEDD